MHIPQEALERLKKLLKKAKKTDLPEPTAMTLATCDRQGNHMARTVLLKDVDERGLVFYTNLGSRKAQQLHDNPKAAICFYWPPLKEQVLVEGSVVPVTDEEANAYCETRPGRAGSAPGPRASRRPFPSASRCCGAWSRTPPVSG